MGSIRNRKIEGKKPSKTAKEFDQNRERHAKPPKTINFHILIIKTLIEPIQSVTSGACRGFAAIRDQWRCIIASQIEEKPEPKRKNRKPHRILNPKTHWWFFTKIENKMLKNGNPHMNTKTEKPEFFGTKNRKKSIWKRAKTVKPKIPVPPS